MTYIIILIVSMIIGILIIFPKWQVKNARKKLERIAPSLSSKEKLSIEKDLISLENTYRLTISQIIGGSVVVLGLYFSLENLKNSQKSLELSQQGQITDRFTKAVNQLSDSNTDINIGGIFALQRIANDSEKDQWPIMEILTAYVRRKVGRSNPNIQVGNEVNYGNGLKYFKATSDIQAVMTVLAERNIENETKLNQKIHLENTYLQGIVLDNANLKAASFVSSNLIFSSFRGANLDSAFFSYAKLNSANFENASMRHSNMQNADANGVDLNNVHLENANLTNADLRNARFKNIYVDGAKFLGTKLGGLDLRNAVGLTLKQFNEAETDEFTLPPEYLK